MPKHVRDIYSTLEKRKGLISSDYHRMQMKTWIDQTAITLKTGTSEAKRDCLINLMHQFCRPLGPQEYSGSDPDARYVNPTAQAGLYSGQKAVLQIIARQIKKLEPFHQYQLLQNFIEHYLEHMGHTMHAAHDPQRQAIKMLEELLPTLKMKPEFRTNLSAWLLHKHTEGKINMDPSVGGLFNREVQQTSDVAARLVSKELRTVRRMWSKDKAGDLADIQSVYDQALWKYRETNKSGATRLHTDIWKKAFNDKELNPSGWTAIRPNKLVKRSHSSTYDNLDHEVMRLENADLRRQIQNLRTQKQGAEIVYRNKDVEPGVSPSQSRRGGSARTSLRHSEVSASPASPYWNHERSKQLDPADDGRSPSPSLTSVQWEKHGQQSEQAGHLDAHSLDRTPLIPDETSARSQSIASNSTAGGSNYEY